MAHTVLLEVGTVSVVMGTALFGVLGSQKAHKLAAEHSQMLKELHNPVAAVGKRYLVQGIPPGWGPSQQSPSGLHHVSTASRTTH